MAKKVYLINETTGAEYWVKRMDKEAGKVYLTDSKGVEFDIGVDEYRPEKLKPMGYRMEVREEDEDA